MLQHASQECGAFSFRKISLALFGYQPQVSIAFGRFALSVLNFQQQQQSNNYLKKIPIKVVVNYI